MSGQVQERQQAADFAGWEAFTGAPVEVVAGQPAFHFWAKIPVDRGIGKISMALDQP